MATATQKRSRRRFFEMLCICATAATIGIVVLPFLPLIDRSENAAQDLMIKRGPRQSLAKEFVFVAIDDPSLKLDHLWPEDIEQSAALKAMAGGWPWPRDAYAYAIEKILAAGAKVVILDLILDATRPGDERLKITLDQNRRKIVLGANLSEDPINQSHRNFSGTAVRLPAPSLIDNATSDARVGYVNFWPDEDSVVRRVIYKTKLRDISHPDEQEYQSLSNAVLHQIGQADRIPKTNGPLHFRFANIDTIPVISFYSLFLDNEWTHACQSGELFKDKIVVIGPNAAIHHDSHHTPIGEIPGPLLHINAIAAALHDTFYRTSGTLANIVIILALSIIAFAITWRFRNPVHALISLAAMAVGYILLAQLIANTADYLPEIIRPISVLMIGGVSCIAWNFAAERRETSRLRSTLDRYVSRNVVREILDNREDFLTALGGTRRPMTILFSDVRGFTSFSESADASVVVEQLNEYLGEMVGIIFRHHGTVDKFMGDGIMAVWGNVVSEGEAADAARAVSAALEMQERLADLNRQWSERGAPAFAIGVGLNHGEAVFGNIGSQEKMEPTVIGDAVNLASRAEGLTKQYGISLCVTEFVADLVRESFSLRSVDRVRVVGKSKPVGIHTILGRKESAPAWLADYEHGIAEFRARRFDQAADLFAKCVAENPDDKLCAIYLQRSRDFAASPPPADWDGTQDLKSK